MVLSLTSVGLPWDDVSSSSVPVSESVCATSSSIIKVNGAHLCRGAGTDHVHLRNFLQVSITKDRGGDCFTTYM